MNTEDNIEALNVRRFCDNLTSSPDWREVVRKIEEGVTDFEVDGVRFIHDDKIDEMQCDELYSNLYILGCFNACSISAVTGVDKDAIIAFQKAGAFEGIGKLITSMGKLEELQQAYARADGFGYHFNYYDGTEEEIRTSHGLYHVFDNR